MKTIKLILLFCVFSINTIYAQDVESRWSYVVEMSLKVPTKVEYTLNNSTANLRSNRTKGFSINATASYFILDKLSIGGGLGLNRFNSPNINGFPIYGDIRYYSSMTDNAFYALLDIGAYLQLNDNFPDGSIARVGVGYKFNGGGVNWIAGLTYEHHHFSMKNDESVYDFPQTVGLTIGLIF